MNSVPSPSWRERMESPLARHCVGFAMLVLVMLGLIVQLAIDSSTLGGSAASREIHEREELRTLTVATLPLRGVDKRVADTGKQIDAFYSQRIPVKYSRIATRLGELEVQSGVRLSHVEYSQSTRSPELTELSISSGVSGEYPQIMRFVNELERDQTFFVIRAMTFQGQQGGLVNLQLRFSTWLRPPDGTSVGLQAASDARARSSSPIVVNVKKGGV